MIYQDILCDIKETLMQTGYFFKFYEYATMQEVNGLTRPMYFVDGSNAVDVMDFDRNGSGYIRKTGPVNLAVSAYPTVTACDDRLLDIILPLRGVFAVPKAKLGNDGFSDDKLALELMGIFNGTQSGVQGVTKLKGRVLRYETDRAKIWQAEVNNETPPLLNLSLVSIDFDLSFTASPECLLQTCY